MHCSKLIQKNELKTKLNKKCTAKKIIENLKDALLKVNRKVQFEIKQKMNFKKLNKKCTAKKFIEYLKNALRIKGPMTSVRHNQFNNPSV